MLASRFALQRNVCATWLVHGVNLAIGFVLMPFVLRTLGNGSYGSWVFINSIAGYASLLYLGFGDTVGRYVSRYHSRQEWQKLSEIVTLIFSVYLSMGAVALLAAGLLAGLAPRLHAWSAESLVEIRLVIVLLGMNVAAGLAGSVFGGILLGMRRYDIERAVSLGAALLRSILIFVFLRREWGLATIASIYLAITLAENAAYVTLAYSLVPRLSIRPRHWKLSVLRECYSFSGFAFLNALASQLIYATDTVVIGVMLGTEAIVPYYIALRLSQFIRQPLQKIGEVCMPAAGALDAQQQHQPLQRLALKALGTSLLMIVGVFIGTVYFGERLIEVWMGPGYGASYPLLLILVGMLIVAIPAGVFRFILFGMGKVRGPALIYLAEAAVNLALSLALCRPLGPLGVALATALPIVVFELGGIVPYGMRVLGISLRQLFRDAVLPQIVPISAVACYAASVSALTGSLLDWTALAAIAAGGGAVLAAGWLLNRKLAHMMAGALPASEGEAVTESRLSDTRDQNTKLCAGVAT